ncbi:MAG: pseudouridine synthase [Candidatus Saccharimonadales bacterium]
MSIESSIRLNKYLALHTGTSRREADDLISAGRVFINNNPAIMGSQVNDGDEVKVDGFVITGDTKIVYIAFNKPVGYVCSRKSQGDNPTIYELLPDEFRSLKPVGRLDKDSSGIILLTNDGDFAQHMTHPQYAKIKRYEVALDNPLEPLHQQMISDIGVTLEDGHSQLTLERRTGDRKRWIVIMSEGRNRQIRRTFGSLGYTVTELHRTNFGPYSLGALQPGKFEEVTAR